MDRNKRIIKNTVVFAIGNFGSKILAYIMVLVYTYYIGKSELGSCSEQELCSRNYQKQKEERQIIRFDALFSTEYYYYHTRRYSYEGNCFSRRKRNQIVSAYKSHQQAASADL